MKKPWLWASLYLAQGLPYGFFSQALPVLLREAGYSLKAISALGFLHLPWALKFLWAPYLDHTSSRRRWLLGLRLSSVFAALALAWLELEGVPAVLLVAAFLFSFLAASEDVITDGLAVRLLGPDERGFANSIQVGAYRVGMILGGGFLLWLFARTNFDFVFVCMALGLGATILPVFSLGEEPAADDRARPARLWLGWLPRVRRPAFGAMVLVILCYRFGDAMVSNQLGPFLSDRGLGKADIAWMKGTVGSATSVLGALLGGFWVRATSRRTAVLGAGLAQALTFTLYVAVALGFGGRALLLSATIVEGLIGTVATVALFTLMMDASDPEHAGTDFTLLASSVIVVNGLGTFCSAVIVDASTYFVGFSVGTLVAAAGCLAAVHVLGRSGLVRARRAT